MSEVLCQLRANRRFAPNVTISVTSVNRKATTIFPPRGSGEGGLALLRGGRGAGGDELSATTTKRQFERPPPPRKRAVPLPRFHGGG